MRSRTGPFVDARTPVGTSALRAHNVAAVMEDVARNQPTLRTAIAARTGLAKGSITTIVEELIGLGLLAESAAQATDRRGRPGALLEVDGRQYAVCAVQVTVSELICECRDLGGRVLRVLRSTHSGPGILPEDLAKQVAALVRSVLHDLDRANVSCLRCVIVIAAPIVGEPPRVWISSDLGWLDTDLVTLVSEEVDELRGRIDLVNDANEAAVAEFEALSNDQPRPRTMLYLKSDTGVGGSVVVDGHTYAGAHGSGLEPAHMATRSGTRLCDCGRHGCVIAEIGPSAVVDAAGLTDLAHTHGLHVAIAEIVDRARMGDAETLQILESTGALLNALIFDLVLAFDPDLIVIGGYWADVFPELHLVTDLDLGLPYLAGARHQARQLSGAFVVAGQRGETAPRDGALRRATAALLATPGELHSTSATSAQLGETA